MKIYYLLPILFLSYSLFAQEKPVDAEGDAQVIQDKYTALSALSTFRSEGTALSAGDEIEGDYIGQMCFTTDGAQVLVPHRQSNNITVFDFETQSIVRDIPVGASPTEVVVTDEYAIVPCLGSNEVYIIQLDDFSVAAVIDAPAQPAKAKVSQDGLLAAVACDEADEVIVIDLATLEEVNTISDFPSFISKFSLITSGPRNTVYWSDFEFSPDNQYLILGAATGLLFYEIETGNISEQLTDAPNASFLGLSGDGTKLVAVKSGNPGVAHLVDLASQSVEQTVTYDGFFSTSYSPVAVNLDGSRALVPSSSGIAALIRFEENDVQEVNTTSSPNWVGSSPDYQYAIAGQFYLTLIDFETGAIAGQSQGRPIQNGIVSPDGNRMVATDPLRYESIDFYTFNNTGFDYLGRASTGSELEADIPYSATFTPQGDRLLVSNSLSGSLSVIDVEEEELEAIIPMSSTETYQVGVTSDGAYAIVAKRLEDEVDIISLESMEVVQSLPSGGSKPDQVYVLPGDEYAYIVNSGGTDAIGVIALNGAASSLESSFACGNTGISWTNYGIRSGFALTPDGQYGLLATPFDEAVQVIDLELHQIVATVDIGGFPLQIAISDETEFGSFAAVTLKNDNAIAVIAPLGPEAALLDVYPCGANPTRIAYNDQSGEFAVCLNDDNAVNYFKLESLAFDNAQSYSDHTPIAISYTENGGAITLLRADEDGINDQVDIFGIETLDLPSTPIQHFAHSPDGQKIAINLPVTDEVFLITTDVSGLRSKRIRTQQSLYTAAPNPFAGQILLNWDDAHTAAPLKVNCRIYDTRGKIVASQDDLSGNQIRLELFSLPAGAYWYQVISEQGVVGSGKLIKK
jgi:YVTN family beta-propeller protein